MALMKRSPNRTANWSLAMDDLTYVAITVGYSYPSTLARKVVGYAIGRLIDARLAMAALKAALESRLPRPASFITRTANRNARPARTAIS